MSSMIISKEVRNIAGDSPFIITGDFNMLPDSRAYAILTGEGNSDSLIVDSHIISETYPSGLDYTFNGFTDEEGRGRIDYIFVRKGTRVITHETKGPKRGELFLSDHWPVVAAVILRARD